jgi:lysyl-tRNA synthetase class 2
MLKNIGKLKIVKSFSSLIFPKTFKPSINLTNFKEKYKGISDQSDNIEHLAGRVYSIRKMGKNLTFMNLNSNSDNLQLVFENKTSPDVNNIKRGYFLGLTGYPFRTKTGELSLYIKNYDILAECQKELPMTRDDKQMLTDFETRYSKRYLDLIVNNSNKEFFILRSRILKFLRNFLEKEGFLEVETPILSHKAGGALATPFATHSKAMKSELYLRIAPELYLKQLIIAGFERVFEIGKNFRNEDISIKHNPEFTSCEFYQAYADYNDLINLTKRFLKELCEEIFGSSKFVQKNGEVLQTIDFSTDYQTFDIKMELENYFSRKLFDSEKDFNKEIDSIFQEYLKGNNLSENAKDLTTKKKLEKLIENIIEPKSEKMPTFIINHPTLLSPLAKSHNDNKLLTERFEFFINKIELINSYSELTDPNIQKQRFEEQNKYKDDESHPIDNDFIEALTYGMPPTAGWGLGIDRLCMILLNQTNIKEVILFPLMNVK